MPAELSLIVCCTLVVGLSTLSVRCGANNAPWLRILDDTTTDGEFFDYHQVGTRVEKMVFDYSATINRNTMAIKHQPQALTGLQGQQKQQLNTYEATFQNFPFPENLLVYLRFLDLENRVYLGIWSFSATNNLLKRGDAFKKEVEYYVDQIVGRIAKAGMYIDDTAGLHREVRFPCEPYSPDIKDLRLEESAGADSSQVVSLGDGFEDSHLLVCNVLVVPQKVKELDFTVDWYKAPWLHLSDLTNSLPLTLYEMGARVEKMVHNHIKSETDDPTSQLHGKWFYEIKLQTSSPGVGPAYLASVKAIDPFLLKATPSKPYVYLRVLDPWHGHYLGLTQPFHSTNDPTTKEESEAFGKEVEAHMDKVLLKENKFIPSNAAVKVAAGYTFEVDFPCRPFELLDPNGPLNAIIKDPKDPKGPQGPGAKDTAHPKVTAEAPFIVCNVIVKVNNKK